MSWILLASKKRMFFSFNNNGCSTNLSLGSRENVVREDIYSTMKWIRKWDHFSNSLTTEGQADWRITLFIVNEMFHQVFFFKNTFCSLWLPLWLDGGYFSMEVTNFSLKAKMARRKRYCALPFDLWPLFVSYLWYDFAYHIILSNQKWIL